MARISTVIAVAPYMAGMSPHKVEAYQTREGSRFAAAKPFKDSKGWDLRHVASGLGLGSLLNPRRYTLAEVLAVIRAIEAHTEIDLSPLDAVEFGKGFTSPPPPVLLQSLREIARLAA